MKAETHEVHCCMDGCDSTFECDCPEPDEDHVCPVCAVIINDPTEPEDNDE
jgi:hypothetical protein